MVVVVAHSYLFIYVPLSIYLLPLCVYIYIYYPGHISYINQTYVFTLLRVAWFFSCGLAAAAVVSVQIPAQQCEKYRQTRFTTR